MYTLGVEVAKRQYHATLPFEDCTSVCRNFAVLHSCQGLGKLQITNDSKILRSRCSVLVRSCVHAAWSIVVSRYPIADPWRR